VYDEVVEVAKKIAEVKGAKLYISVVSSQKKIKLEVIAKDKSWGEYLIENAAVALQALDILGIFYDVDDLNALELFGRFYPLRENIRIDVGHNPLAAKAIEKALNKKVVLIYNSLDDKDYEAVLNILKPKVKRVEIIPIHSQRATILSQIEEAVKKVGIPCNYFEGKIDKDEYYLVFGSFYVVEEFLNKMQKKSDVPK
jgi:dihydrofolate synthase/folylpolyglutamate synthase